MLGPLVYLVAYVYMVKRMLDFLRVKNNGRSYRRHIGWRINDGTFLARPRYHMDGI